MNLLQDDVASAEPLAVPRAAAPVAARVCVFTLGRDRFAVPVTGVREIATVDHVTPVPGATACVLGAINLRGTLVSLVTIEALFGLTRRRARVTRAIVLAHPTVRVAIAVDDVVDMAAVDEIDPATMLDPSTLITRLKNQEER
jgi:chemotaxis signal transduction protein